MKFFGLEINMPFFGGKEKEKIELRPDDEYRDPIQTVGLPVMGGSEKVYATVTPTDISSVAGLNMSSRPLSNKDYDKLYQLARTNHDVSFAILNIVELGNTPYKIEFDKGVSDAQAAKMAAELNNVEKSWYKGGIKILVNSLLRQVAITGAISAEAQPLRNLSGVGRVVLLSPKWVYYVYDGEYNVYRPYQQNVIIGNTSQNSGFVADKTPSRYGFAYHPLSERTYMYLGLHTDEDKPYAIPPMLSALEAICIENDMLDNLSAIVRRIGLLGFLEVVVAAPNKKQQPGGKVETDEEYIIRVQEYLQTIVPQVEKGLSNGYVIGAKQYSASGTEIKTDFNMVSSPSGSGGAESLIELMMQIKAAGLKQDPVFLGKNFSTTEALAKVLINKFSAQIQDYQNAVASFLVHAYTLHLQLCGFKFGWIKVEFDPPTMDDNKVRYEGLLLKFDYHLNLYNQGIISQQQFALAMGYEEPEVNAPRLTPEQELAAAQSQVTVIE